MGKSQREKGSRVERRILKMFQAAGMNGKRVGFLPALGIPTSGDLEIEGKKFEVKSRKKGEGFKLLIKWIEDCDGLVLVANNKEPLIVQRISDWIKREAPHDTVRDNPGDDL